MLAGNLGNNGQGPAAGAYGTMLRAEGRDLGGGLWLTVSEAVGGGDLATQQHQLCLCGATTRPRCTEHNLDYIINP